MLGYAGFLRHDEIVKLHFSDLLFKKGHVELTIRSSKTDKYRDGDTVVIACTGSLACPVAMLERWSKSLPDLRINSSGPINARSQALKEGK